MRLLYVVLESHDAELQKYFIGPSRYSYYHYDSKPLLLAYITESELDAFYELLQHGTWVVAKRSGTGVNEPRTFAVDAILNRLEGLARGADGRMAPQAVSVIASFLQSDHVSVSPPQAGKLFDAIAPLLDGCFQPRAPEAEVSACGDLVQGVLRKLCLARRDTEPQIMHTITDGRSERGYQIVQKQGPCTNWKDVPPAIRGVCRRFLGYVNHKVHGQKAFAALRTCYSRLTGLPAGEVEQEMLGAMDTARAAVMEKATADDQVELLASMAWANDETIQAPAVAELQRRITAGTVPPGKRETAYHALAQGAAFLTPESARSILERVADPKEEFDLRWCIVDELFCQPSLYEQFFLVFETLLDEEPKVVICPWWLPRLVVELRRLSKENLPPPSWAKAAAGLALKIARSPKGRESGEVAVDLFTAAAGAGGGPTLEALAQDATLHPCTRAAAAQWAVELKPDTTLLATLLENYPKLPLEMREQLAGCSAGAPDTPGAEAFVLRALKDREVLARRYIISHLGLPLTPTLLAGLKELEADPILGQGAKQAIERLEKKQGHTSDE